VIFWPKKPSGSPLRGPPEGKDEPVTWPNESVAIWYIMRFGGRANRSNEKLDENFGRNLKYSKITKFTKIV
jgi:hypothetical protein